MIVLSSRLAHRPEDFPSGIFRLCEDAGRPSALAKREVFLGDGDDVPPGFAAALTRCDTKGNSSSYPIAVLPQDLHHLADGDIVRLTRDGRVRALFRGAAPMNYFLLTERCNHYCLMCSQPPKAVDDDWLLDELFQVIRLIPRSTESLGVSGGEPTLLGDRFLSLIQEFRSYLPNTAIHVLSNGRLLAQENFISQLAKIGHSQLSFGIPLYSDIARVHDHVVQAQGAFDETLAGLLLAAKYRVKVEVRVVLHALTVDRLPDLAEFIARNLPFVSHVALMGLEITGFTRANLEQLWIDPYDYRRELREAVKILDAAGLQVSIFNHQLCLLDESLWKFSVRSISDWKNEYQPECAGCLKQDECGGFFSSSKIRYSSRIRPFTAATP